MKNLIVAVLVIVLLLISYGLVLGGTQRIPSANRNDITSWWNAYYIGNSTANAIIADTTSNFGHYIESPDNTLVPNKSYVFSSEVKAGEVNWIVLSHVDYLGAWTDTYFDLENGVIGTDSERNNSEIENVGDGWYRCTIRFTALTGSYYTVAIFAAEDDLDSIFAGDDEAVSIYIRNISLLKVIRETNWPLNIMK